MPSLYIQTVMPSRASSVRLSPNIGGLARPRPSCSVPTESCYNDDMAPWLYAVYNLRAALNEAKQLRKARALSLRHQIARPRLMLFVLSRLALL